MAQAIADNGDMLTHKELAEVMEQLKGHPLVRREPTDAERRAACSAPARVGVVPQSHALVTQSS